MTYAVGDHIGQWHIIALPNCKDRGGNIQVLAKCVCGIERLVRRSRLKSGKSKSCGCLNIPVPRYRKKPTLVEIENLSLFPVKGYEEYFFANKKGDIYSTGSGRLKKLKLQKNKQGYFTFSTSFGGRQGEKKTLSVHRLIANTFIDNPNNKCTVNHKDFDRANNNVNNLEWCSIQENTQYSVMHKRHQRKKGALSYRAVLTMEQVRYIRCHYKPFDSIYSGRALAKMFCVSTATISYIIKNKGYLE